MMTEDRGPWRVLVALSLLVFIGLVFSNPPFPQWGPIGTFVAQLLASWICFTYLVWYFFRGELSCVFCRALPVLLASMCIKAGVPPAISSSLAVLLPFLSFCIICLILQVDNWPFNVYGIKPVNIVLAVAGLMYPLAQTYIQGQEKFDDLHSVELVESSGSCGSSALFAHISDIHALADPFRSTLDGERSGIAKLKDLLDGIATHSPSYLLVSGDITDHGETAEWEAVTRTLLSFSEKTGIKIIMSPGNHDLSKFFNQEDKGLSQLEEYLAAQYNLYKEVRASTHQPIGEHIARIADPKYSAAWTKLRSCENTCNTAVGLMETSWLTYESMPSDLRRNASIPQRLPTGYCPVFCRGSHMNELYRFEQAGQAASADPDYASVVNEIERCTADCFQLSVPGSPLQQRAPAGYCRNACAGSYVGDAHLVERTRQENPRVDQDVFPLYLEDTEKGLAVLSLMLPTIGDGTLWGTNAAPSVDAKQVDWAKQHLKSLDGRIKTVVVIQHYPLTRGPGDKWSGPDLSWRFWKWLGEIENSNWFLYSFLLPKPVEAEPFVKFLADTATQDGSRKYFLLFGHRHMKTLSRIGALTLVEAPNVASELKDSQGFYLYGRDTNTRAPVSWCPYTAIAERVPMDGYFSLRNMDVLNLAISIAVMGALFFWNSVVAVGRRLNPPYCVWIIGSWVVVMLVLKTAVNYFSVASG
jgi:hypothetical protein